MTRSYRAGVLLATVLQNPWQPHKPTHPQAKFLLAPQAEALYGGAAGGGKSDALLMAAAQYAGVPGYSALLLRRTYADLALPGAIMDRSHQWWDGSGARWHEQDKTWRFPGGGTITFGYLETEKDKYRYQGAEFQFIGFDELTQFTETQYAYLASRLRRLEGVQVPLRMRSATNPGGVGHDWVLQRFIVEGPQHGRLFVPAKLEDNPHLDREAYEASLLLLDPVTRAQLRHGDWYVRPDGELFKREWFPVIEQHQVPPLEARVRWWDLAATEAKAGTDPDWSVGTLAGWAKGTMYVLDVCRMRGTPQQVEQALVRSADQDGREVPVWVEQEPGSSGKLYTDHLQRRVLPGHAVYAKRSTGNKLDRMRPLSAAAEQGRVVLVRGPWVTAWLDEVVAVPHGGHDDQADSAAGAHSVLAHTGAGGAGSAGPGRTSPLPAARAITTGAGVGSAGIGR